MGSPELSTIEVGNTLEDTEKKLIDSLSLDAFDIDKNSDNNKDELKNVLKGTKIKVIMGINAEQKETIEEKTLLEIADDFASYIEKGEGWTLKVKEGKTDTPKWIQYIIENPKNNDLAFFIQKIAKLIEYQTAKIYTEKELAAVDVSIDKTFGNQTKRALAGLKTWIENDSSTIEKTTFLSKNRINDIITQNTKGENIYKPGLNNELNQYNLIFDDDKRIKPAEGYEFIDPNSNNYAVKLKESKAGVEKESTNTQNNSDPEIGKIDNGKVFESGMYENLTDEIRKIKISEFINKYKDTYPGVASCFNNISPLFIPVNKKNPYFQIEYKTNDNYSNNRQTEKISLRECIDDKGYLEKDKFFEKVFESIQPTIEANEKSKKNEKLLKSIRGKTFTQNELFGNKHDDNNFYAQYFGKFDDNKVLIDKDVQYTKIEGDILKLCFNDKYMDEKYNSNVSLPLKDITDSDGNFAEDKFKIEIVKKIENIIETHFM